MKRSLELWQVGGLTFSAVLGTLLHFLYSWTGLLIFAPLSAINESTWEHMKLLFFPSFIYAIIESVFLFNQYPNFWKSKFFGILIGLITIPVLFYTYNGAIGKSPDWFNILSFFISLFVEYYTEYLILKKGKKSNKYQAFYILGLFFIAVSFIVFTFAPPQLPLFTPPKIG